MCSKGGGVGSIGKAAIRENQNIMIAKLKWVCPDCKTVNTEEGKVGSMEFECSTCNKTHEPFSVYWESSIQEPSEQQIDPRHVC